MLKDIQKAEEEARLLVENARTDAETIVKEAREEASRTIQKAEDEVRTLKTNSMNEGIETGKREAEKILTKAQTEIKNQEHTADAMVAKAADAVVKKITENF